MSEGKRERTRQFAADRAKRVVLGILAGQDVNVIAQELALHVNHAYEAWRLWLSVNHPEILAAVLHRPRKGRIAWARERVLAKQHHLLDIRASRATVAFQLVSQSPSRPIPPIIITRPGNVG